MSSHKSSNVLVFLMLALALVLAACGGAQVDTPVEEAAPLAAVQEAAAVEEAAAGAAAGAVAEEEVVEAVEFDLVAAMDDYLSTIPEGFLSVKLDAFNEMLASAQPYLIDVREVAEYEEGHIPGAVNIPLRTLAQNLDQVPADQPVIIYCKSGHRAGLATTALQVLGYDNVRAFAPSYKAWTAADGAVEMEPVAAGNFAGPDIEPELLAAVDDFLSTIPEGFLAMGDMEKFNEAIENGAFLVDVREVSEYEAGHLPGAINIPIRTLAQNLDQIPTDQPVFVYCKSGFRAALSTAALQTMDFSNVRSFPPGFSGWEAAGQPIAALQ